MPRADLLIDEILFHIYADGPASLKPPAELLPMPPRTQPTGDDEISHRDEGEQRYRVEAVTRAVRLLKALQQHPGLDTAALAEAADAPLGFTQVALETIAKQGLARHVDGDGDNWELGFAWLRLAAARSRQIDLRELALPIMRRMRDAVDETVILGVRRGGRRVNIDYVESTQAIRRVTQHGHEAPLHVGASGRALLCGLTAEEIGEYFASDAGRNARLLDVEKFIAELADVRRNGYADVKGGLSEDSWAVAAPVRDHTRAIIAALTISAPSDRFTPELEAACIANAREGAAELSRLLGYTPANRTDGAS